MADTDRTTTSAYEDEEESVKVLAIASHVSLLRAVRRDAIQFEHVSICSEVFMPRCVWTSRFHTWWSDLET
jgi:hypothetical protein